MSALITHLLIMIVAFPLGFITGKAIRYNETKNLVIVAILWFIVLIAFILTTY